MQQFAIYSVIPPEGCSAILWRDSNRKVDAAEALKLTAPDLLKAGIVDAIVPEPLGGAHQDPAEASALLGAAIEASLIEVSALTPEARLDSRYGKFRGMGRLGIDFVDAAADGAFPSPASRPS
jgi:acetyl-CoA carboxylase carboxyl transferase subunit alpha